MKIYKIKNEEDGTTSIGNESAVIHYANMICDMFDEWHKVKNGSIDTLKVAKDYLMFHKTSVTVLVNCMNKLNNDYVVYIEDYK